MLLSQLLILFFQEAVAERLPELLPPAPRITRVAVAAAPHPTATAFWSWMAGREGAAVELAEDDGSAEVYRHLRRLRDPSESPDAVAEALAALGVRPLDVYFSVLASGVVGESEGQPEQGLSQVQRRALATTLRHLPQTAVLSGIDRWITEHPEDPGAIGAWLDTLGAVGRDAELERILEWARTESTDLDRARREQLRRVFAELYPRCKRPFSALDRAWAGLDDGFLRAALEAAGDTADERALPWATTVLSWRDDQAPVVLGQLPRILGDGPERDYADLVALVTRHLDPDHPNLASAACQALGALEDPACTSSLVELLESGDAAVRAAAHYALQRIGGVGLPLSAKLWRHWLELEATWYQRQRPADLAGLRSGLVTDRAAALKSLAEHRLYRHELAPEIAALVVDLEGPSLAVACGTLVALGSKRAVPGLVEALTYGAADPEPAKRALEALLRAELPDSPDDLAAWLSERGLGA